MKRQVYINETPLTTDLIELTNSFKPIETLYLYYYVNGSYQEVAPEQVIAYKKIITMLQIQPKLVMTSFNAEAGITKVYTIEPIYEGWYAITIYPPLLITSTYMERLTPTPEPQIIRKQENTTGYREMTVNVQYPLITQPIVITDNGQLTLTAPGMNHYCQPTIQYDFFSFNQQPAGTPTAVVTIGMSWHSDVSPIEYWYDTTTITIHPVASQTTGIIYTDYRLYALSWEYDTDVFGNHYIGNIYLIEISDNEHIVPDGEEHYQFENYLSPDIPQDGIHNVAYFTLSPLTIPPINTPMTQEIVTYINSITLTAGSITITDIDPDTFTGKTGRPGAVHHVREYSIYY